MTKARENTLIPAKHNKTRSEMNMGDEEREREMKMNRNTKYLTKNSANIISK